MHQPVLRKTETFQMAVVGKDHLARADPAQLNKGGGAAEAALASAKVDAQTSAATVTRYRSLQDRAVTQADLQAAEAAAAAAAAVATQSYFLLFFVLIGWQGLIRSEQLIGLQRGMSKQSGGWALAAYLFTTATFLVVAWPILAQF